jgi:hypothetical protein
MFPRFAAQEKPLPLSVRLIAYCLLLIAVRCFSFWEPACGCGRKPDRQLMSFSISPQDKPVLPGIGFVSCCRGSDLLFCDIRKTKGEIARQIQGGVVLQMAKGCGSAFGKQYIRAV